MKKTSALVATVVAGAVLSIAGAAFSASNLKTDLFNGDGGGNGVVQQMDQEQQQEEQFRRDLDNERRHMNDRNGECKNMRMQLKQAKKIGSQAVADIEARVTDFCNAIEEAKKALNSITDRDAFDTLRMDVIQGRIGDVAPELWDGLKSFNDEADVLRGIKENSKRCKDYSRQLKEIVREAKRAKMDVTGITALGQEKVSECEANYKQLKEYAANRQFEEARDLLEEFFWNNEVQDFFNELREEAMACSGVGRIVAESSKEVKMVKRALAKFKKMGLDTEAAEYYFAQALEIIERAKAISKSGSCDRNDSESLVAELDEVGSYLEEEMENLKSAVEFGDDEFGDR